MSESVIYRPEPRTPDFCLEDMVALKRLQCTAEFLRLCLNGPAPGSSSWWLPCCLGWGTLHCCSCTSPHQPSCSLPLTIIGYIRDLESFGTVPFIGLELDPEFLGPGGEGYGALVGLAGLVRGHRVGRSFQSKHTTSSCGTMLPAKELLELFSLLPPEKCSLVLRKLLKMWQAISGWQAINEGLLGEGIFSFFLK